MEAETMGRVRVAAKLENIGDLSMVDKKLLSPEEVRTIELDDAVVDTGATGLSIPKRMIDKPGLERIVTRTAVTGAGVVQFGVHGTVRLTIQGRDCPTDVTELPEECPVLIGQIPPGGMDWVIDMKNHCIIGNPRHGGEPIIEPY